MDDDVHAPEVFRVPGPNDPKRATLDDVVAALLLMKHTLDEIAYMLQDVKGKTPDGMGVLDVRVNKD